MMCIVSSLRCIVAALVLIVIFAESDDEILSLLKDKNVCPTQPAVLDQLLQREGSPRDNDCIFNRLSSDEEGRPSQSSLVVSENAAVPDNQGWSRCQHCGWKDKKFMVFSSDNRAVPQSIDVSWSLWGEFFFHHRNDQYKAEVQPVQYLENIIRTDGGGLSYYIDRPVYILPMITFHAGHILIDVLEQVYRSMIATYGQIRLDSLIVIDVASQDERAILQERLYLNIHHPTVSSLGSLITLLTSLPVLSMKVFDDLSDDGTFVLFKDVHIGLDNSETYFYRGYEIHPMVFPTKNQSKSIKTLSRKYIEFRDFIQNGTRNMAFPKAIQNNENSGSSEIHGNSDAGTAESTDLTENELYILNWANEHDKGTLVQSTRILFVNREKNRVILSIKELEIISEEYGAVLGVNELGNIPFNEQLLMFLHTDILIAVAGTALHNMLFMRPGTSVIILMQPGWCDWAWMYANQAVLLGIHYFIYCADSASYLSSTSVSDSQISYPLSNKSSVNDKNNNNENRTNNKDDESNDNNENDGNNKRIVEELPGFHWTRKFWLQGPRTMKSENVTVNVEIFLSLLLSALDAFEGHSEGSLEGYSDDSKELLDEHVDLSIPLYGVSTPLERYSEANTSDKRDTILYVKEQKKILEVFISTINIEVVQAPVIVTDGVPSPPQIAWRIAILGEFISVQGRADLMAANMPHMVICVRSLLSVSEPWCSALEGVNYYSDIFLTFTEPVQTLQLWAQVAESGGKIKGSDLFYSIDANIPDGGSKVHTESIGLTLRDVVEMEGDVDPLTGEKIKVNVLYEQYIADKYTLQRSIVDFCLLHELNDVSCGFLSAQLSAVAYKAVQMKSLNMPDKQYLPTPEKPLVFVHIEKTGGTTLREFIAESSHRLGLQHFIPCHDGIHCITLSLSGDVERRAPDSEEWEYDLVKSADIREELKNVSIVAGHFFWDVWQDLPNAMSIKSPKGVEKGIENRQEKGLERGLEKGLEMRLKRGLEMVEKGLDKGQEKEIKVALYSTSKSLDIAIDVDIDVHGEVARGGQSEEGASKGGNRGGNGEDSSLKGGDSPNPHNQTSLREEKAVPPCIIIGRHPIERAISYYYQRCYRSDHCVGFNKRFNELTVDELSSFIKLKRQGGFKSDNITTVVLDEGLEDAACRALANEKATTGLVVGVDELLFPPPLTPEAVVKALDNSKRCVVGILERWEETKEVLNFWFPWLDFSKDSDRKKMFIYSGKETNKSIKPELAAEVLRVNNCDMQLYNQMFELFDKELSIVKGDPFNLNN